MHTSKHQEWNTLTNISSFMTHNELRKQLNIFGQLDAELDFTEYLIRSEIHKADEPRFRSKRRKKELKTDLVKALQSLTIQELIAHYNVMVEQIVNIRQNIFTAPPLPSSSFLITQAFARSYTLKLWKRKKLRFDRENHIIYAQKDKKIKIYDLGNYLVRKSSSSDFVCLVLEAINDVPLEKSKTVHFGFEYKNTFNLWMQNIQASVNYKQWERLGALLHKRDQIIQHQRTLQEEKQQHLAESKLGTRSSAEITSNLHQETNQSKNHSHEIIPVRQLSNRSSAKSALSQIQQFDNSFQLKISQACQSQEQGTIDLHEVITQSYAYRLINQNLAITIEELQYQLQKETHALKNAKRVAPIYKIILKDYQLSEVLSLQDFKSTSLKMSENMGKVTLHECTTDRTHLKLTYVSPSGAIKLGHNKQKLLKRLLDPQSLSKLNPKVEKLQIKSVIESQNCTINVEEHTPFNKLFRARQFVYLRHLTRDEAGQYFIIDRSIEQAMLGSKEHLVRGTLFNITCISEDNNQITVLSDIRLQYKGNLLQQQEIKHSQKYLHNFAEGLSLYFQHPPEDPPKLTLYNYDLISPISHGQGPNQASKSKLDEQTQRANSESDKGFFRIPPAEVLIERNRYIESIYTSSIEENRQTSQYINRAFEPPRKPNNNYLNPKLGFLNREQDNFDWKAQVIPTWTSEWAVDEQFGGLTYIGSYLKQKELKAMLQYTSRAAIKQKQCSKLSFPADTLAPSSHLERLLKSMAYAPSLFDHCLGLPPLQRLKKTITFAILTTLLSLRVVNDFDPILGETYQCQIPSSCKGYAQQMRDNMVGVLVVGKEYQISSLVETRLKVLMNSAMGQSHGVYKVKFNDLEQICFTMPPWELTGLVYSTPTFRLQGKSHFWMIKQRLLVELDFQAHHSFSTSPQAKKDSFRAAIYQVTPQFMASFPSARQMPDEGNVEKVLAKIEGRWTKYITFGDEKVLLNAIPLFEMSNEHNSLPSDSSFREDINCLKVGKMQAAQAKKEALEDQERYDQRLRERAHYY